MAKLPAGYRRLKNGRLENRFTINGKRYSVYGETVEICRNKENQKREEITAGIDQHYNPTVQQFFDKFIDSQAGYIKPSTLINKKSTINKMLSQYIPQLGTNFGNLKIKEVKKADINALITVICTYQQATTANNNIKRLKQIFNAAVDEDIIIKSPLAGIRSVINDAVPAAETTHRALTRDETAGFLATAKDNSYYYNLYRFLLHTGCRIGESSALTPAEITAEYITIRHTATRDESGATIGTPKTESGRRDIPLTPPILQIINDQQRLNKMLFGIGFNDKNRPIFRSITDKLINNVVVNRDIEYICGLAGIERITAHAFRATFATRCIENGMNIKTLQTLLGHSDFNLTMSLYAHCLPDTKRDELTAVNFI